MKQVQVDHFRSPGADMHETGRMKEVFIQRKLVRIRGS